MSLGEVDAALKELPYYKSILKSLLRKQIASLIEELALETGEESVFLIADKSTGSTSCLSSSNAKHFIEAHNDIETKFLSFLNGNANVETHGIRTPRTGKRKMKNDQKYAKTPKQAKINALFSSAVNTVDETVSESVDTTRIDSESTDTQSESVCIENEASEETGIAVRNNFDGVNIKIEPLDVTIPDLTIVKNELSHSQTEASEMNVSTDLNCEPIAPVDQNQNDSATSSPGGTQTFGPIRFVSVPAKGSRKRSCLTMEEKIELIKDLEKGDKTQGELAAEYNIGRSTVSCILKRRNFYIEQAKSPYYNARKGLKMLRYAYDGNKYVAVSEKTWKWFDQNKNGGVPMNGPIIQKKAQEFARKLGLENFKASSGWLTRWRHRYGIDDLLKWPVICKGSNIEK